MSSSEAQLSHKISTSGQAVNSIVGSVLAPNIKKNIDCVKFLKTPGRWNLLAELLRAQTGAECTGLRNITAEYVCIVGRGHPSF